MPPFKVLSPELNYGRRDTINDLSKLAITYLMKNKERKEDKKESDRLAQLNLLAGELRDAKSDLRGLKADYGEKSIIHESIFGANPNNPQYTREAVDLSGDIMQDYKNTIESKEKEIDFYNIQGKNIVMELAAADRVQKNIGSIGYEYGDDPLRYEAGDVTPEVLSSQFGIDEELMEKILTANPLLTSPQFLRSMELLRQQSLAKEEDIKTTQETLKTIESALTLGNSRFMRQMDMADIKSTAGESDKTVKEFATTMYNEKDQPYHVGDLLLPGATLEQKYAEVINLHTTIGSLSTATPDKVGLTRYVTKWKQEWESEQDPISKAAWQTNLKELFNIDISQSEQFIYQEYIMGATEDPFESTIRNSYMEAVKVDSSLELQSYIDDNMEIIMKMYKNMFGDQGTLKDFKKKLSAVSNK